MSGVELMKAINEIDDHYITLAYYEKKKVFLWNPYKAAMVCCLVALLLIVGIFGHSKMAEYRYYLQTKEGDEMKLYVQKTGANTVSTSIDGALSWSGADTPEFYMALQEERLTEDITGIPIVIYNNSDTNLAAELSYSLYAWEDNTWVPLDNGLIFTQQALKVPAKASYEMSCDLQNIQLKPGKYLLSKTVVQGEDKSIWTLSTEFTVE